MDFIYKIGIVLLMCASVARSQDAKTEQSPGAAIPLSNDAGVLQQQVLRLAAQLDQLKQENESLKRALAAKSAAMDAVSDSGGDLNVSSSASILSDFGADARAASNKYGKAGMLKVQGTIYGFDFDIGSDHGEVEIGHAGNYKIVVQITRDQLKLLPFSATVTPDPTRKFLIVGSPHYDGGKDAIVATLSPVPLSDPVTSTYSSISGSSGTTGSITSSSRPVVYSDVPLWSKGGALVAMAQFDRLQEGKIVFVAQ